MNLAKRFSLQYNVPAPVMVKIEIAEEKSEPKRKLSSSSSLSKNSKIFDNVSPRSSKILGDNQKIDFEDSIFEINYKSTPKKAQQNDHINEDHKNEDHKNDNYKNEDYKNKDHKSEDHNNKDKLEIYSSLISDSKSKGKNNSLGENEPLQNEFYFNNQPSNYKKYLEIEEQNNSKLEKKQSMKEKHKRNLSFDKDFNHLQNKNSTDYHTPYDSSNISKSKLKNEKGSTEIVSINDENYDYNQIIFHKSLDNVENTFNGNEQLKKLLFNSQKSGKTTKDETCFNKSVDNFKNKSIDNDKDIINN